MTDPPRIAAHAEWTMADNITAQARENREYVRRLLKERQPDFAAVLESVVRELACQMCPKEPAAGRGPRSPRLGR